MTTRVEDGVVQVLRTALKKIEDESATLDRLADEKRREFEEYVARQHASLDRRCVVLKNALAAMAVAEVENGMDEADTDEDDGPRLAISDGNLDIIREYIEANDGQVRQQDVVSDTGLNSGVVSVGLRRLDVEGEIERAGKDRGSQVWRARQPIMAGGIASIRPGVGVTEANRI